MKQSNAWAIGFIQGTLEAMLIYCRKLTAEQIATIKQDILYCDLLFENELKRLNDGNCNL